MPKNIVVMLDGTSNEIGTNRSNILRLYGTLSKSEDQIVYYDPGVGTFGAENAWSKFYRKALEIWGMATGWGLDANVKDAYRFLVDTYETDADGNGDRIYIFGFSRGAYSARILAGFLHAFGLIKPHNLNLLDYAYRAYKRIGETSAENAFEEIRMHERFLQPERPTIRLLGLFDTVASVVESGRFLPQLRRHAFTSNNPSVHSVRHAVAISERRTMFRPLLWPMEQEYREKRFDPKSAQRQDARETWFMGVHADVGGGYPETEAQLAKFPLYWMIRQTETMDLKYKTRTINELVLGKRDNGRYVRPVATAEPHNSMSAGWSVLEFLPRKKPALSNRTSILGWIIPFFERRVIPEGAKVHASVLKRTEAPPNLPEHYDEDRSAMPEDEA